MPARSPVSATDVLNHTFFLGELVRIGIYPPSPDVATAPEDEFQGQIVKMAKTADSALIMIRGAFDGGSASLVITIRGEGT